MNARRLAVSLGPTLVGSIEVDRRGDHSFTPDPAWLASGQRPRLGLYFLQRPQRVASTHLPLWFENLLPERDSPLRRRLARHHDLREGQSFDLLRVLGRDLPGAVRVEGDEALEPGGEAGGDAATEVAGGALRFSLAGVQLKFSVTARGTNLTLPVGSDEGSWIVKLAGRGFEDLPAVELATMSWARETGLPVPECRLVRVADVGGLESFAPTGEEVAFAIRRYDRSEAGVRVHQEDFAQIVHVDPQHKYGDTGPRRMSLDGLAKLAADACGEDALAALVERFAFVVASGNGDAHLKNWSIVYPDGVRPELAPCYDQVCTVAWPEEFGWSGPSVPKLGLRLGGARKFSHLGRPTLAAFAERVGLVARQVEERFMAALERARATWPSVADSAPACMREALVEHWARVPLLDELGGLRG